MEREIHGEGDMAIHLLCFLSFLIRFHVPHSKFTFSFLTEFFHRKLSRDEW
ncbi:hypothetical protein OROMI_000948 [Orobanche minor]